MKHLLTILATLIKITSFAQCDITLPNSYITGLTLSNGNSNGDTYFKGKMTILTSYNLNNWHSLWFSDSVNVYQNINFPSDGNVNSVGYNTFNYVNFTGNSHFNISGECQIFSIVSNNSNSGSYNTITLYNNALFFCNGIQYNVGDTIQLSGNASNRVYVLGCNTQPLETTFESFYLKNGRIHWKVNSDYKVHVQYQSSGNFNVNLDSFSLECKPHNQIDSIKAYEGYYRLWVNGETSNVIMVKWDDVKPSKTKRVELYRVNDLIATKIVKL